MAGLEKQIIYDRRPFTPADENPARPALEKTKPNGERTAKTHQAPVGFS
jgi:hypothetical protein